MARGLTETLYSCARWIEPSTRHFTVVRVGSSQARDTLQLCALDRAKHETLYSCVRCAFR